MGGKNSSLTKTEVNDLVNQIINKKKIEEQTSNNSIPLVFQNPEIKKKYYAKFPNKSDVYDYNNSYIIDQENIFNNNPNYYNNSSEYDILSKNGIVNINELTTKIVDEIAYMEKILNGQDGMNQSSYGDKMPNQLNYLKFKRKNILRDALKYETKNGKDSITA